jgi:hypothetical protein
MGHKDQFPQPRLRVRYVDVRRHPPSASLSAFLSELRIDRIRQRTGETRIIAVPPTETLCWFEITKY